MFIIIDKVENNVYDNEYLEDYYMRAETNQRKVLVVPRTVRILSTLGEQIRLARRRRRLSVELIAERAGVSRTTVWKVEKGNPSVAIGIYAKILAAIGLQEDLLLVAKDDALGRLMQDAELERRR